MKYQPFVNGVSDIAAECSCFLDYIMVLNPLLAVFWIDGRIWNGFKVHCLDRKMRVENGRVMFC